MFVIDISVPAYLPARHAECDCPLEHSVVRLGHCRTCPHAGRFDPPMPEVPLAPGCPPRHADGTPHDFGWATYADDRQAYGVCRCGYDCLSEMLWEAP